jgi:predicted alpha/beta hydrolase family esterase
VTRTLILPGFYNSDRDHWQSRWEARDETLLRVIQDDWETPRCTDWVTSWIKRSRRPGRIRCS